MSTFFRAAFPARARIARGAAAALAFLAVTACDRPAAPTPVVAVDPDSSVKRWSHGTTWPGGVAPTPGSDVVIPAGSRVVLDVSPAAIRTLVVAGELVAGDHDVELRAERIHVSGRLTAGTAAAPHRARFTITLTGTPADGDAMGKGIMVDVGGALSLHGEPRLTWTRLAASASAGATRIVLEREMGWRAGDRIAIAATGDDQLEGELATVRSVDGAAVELAEPLRAAHRGEVRAIAGQAVPLRAEVGLLTHNIVVRGDDASEASQLGAHVMVMRGGSARIDGVEFNRVGQRGRLARYPFHWHMAGSVAGQYVTRSSMWRSYSRCLTIHGTHDAVVSDNVCYDHVGHGFFMEDGVETGNTVRRNLGMVSRRGELLPSDQLPATYWITNPDNTYEHNVAAGSVAHGFWISAPKHPTGMSATTAVYPMHTPLRRFHANVAHSNDGDGFHVEEDGSTFGQMLKDFRPRAGGRPDGAPVPAVYTDLLAYRNTRGFWARGDHQYVHGGTFADNYTGIQIGDASIASNSEVRSALVVGASGAGTPKSLPFRGVVIYDGPLAFHGVTFANFPAAHSGAIGPAHGYTGRSSVRNAVAGARFVDAAPYYVLPTLAHLGERMATIRDVDGSMTGVAGTTVAPAAMPFTDTSCVVRQDWRARLCATPFVTLRVADGRGVTPAVVEQAGGASVDFPYYDPTLLAFVAPASGSYTLRAPSMTGSYNVQADGLAAGSAVTMVTPWTGTPSLARFDGTWHPLPMVASAAELAGVVQTSAWHDAATQRVHIRFVGRTDEARQTVGVRALE